LLSGATTRCPIRDGVVGFAGQIIRAHDITFDERATRDSEKIPLYAREIARLKCFMRTTAILQCGPERTGGIGALLPGCMDRSKLVRSESHWYGDRHPVLSSLGIVNWFNCIVRNADHAEERIRGTDQGNPNKSSYSGALFGKSIKKDQPPLHSHALKIAIR
jgi:hypothetical protein